MEYDEVAAAYLTPSDEPVPEPEVPTTPARRLRDALEAVATQGWWSRPANDRLAVLGLDFFGGYVWGRAAALGTPPASVVVAAFGAFEPGLLMAVYEQGRTAAGRDDVLAARSSGAEETVASLITDDEAAAVAEPLLDALAGVDGMGRPLFSALRQLPVPASPAGRLWRAAELVREHRGDGHLAAAVAAGLDVATLNVLTELWLGYPLGAYSGTRGYGPDAIAAAMTDLQARGWADGDALSHAGIGARLALEAATDASQRQLVERLGDRIEALTATAAELSARLVAAGTAPADPRKRAAG